MKASSFEIINYALRPAKAAERKMLCEFFRRLQPFAPVESYRYVGFGSIYFTDFQLFHQALGISDMISIEKETEKELRFEFNKPYRCIEIKMGESGAILPNLDWGKRVIVWLDYDGKLNRSVLADVATTCAKACSGSMLLVSINIQPDRTDESKAKDQDENRRRALAEAVGEGNIPLGVSGAELRGPKLAEVCRRIILNTVKQELANRNAPLDAQEALQYQQLVNFRYADGAKMLTVGGLLFQRKDADLLSRCSFDALPFYCPDERAYEIRAPRLTPKELRHLNGQLPRVTAGQVQVPGIPESDVQDYAAIYRYYPNFGEVVLG